jgi:hypothetical protein
MAVAAVQCDLFLLYSSMWREANEANASGGHQSAAAPAGESHKVASAILQFCLR